MNISYTPTILSDADELVTHAVNTKTEINVTLIAELVQARNPLANVALEDIETLVMKTAERHHAPMFFSGTTERRTAAFEKSSSLNGSASLG